ncbi:MAG: hypothetical protein IBX39_04765 [Candidatus Methanoperedenaceae archaeon]|nr:hypothetical protein [Candidatus Methanoperedenaceae archaeon]MDW7726634.1 hypothetical protein [Candidatus Methanoperedens sp.]
MVEIQSAIEMAEEARKVKKPEVAAAEKKRLEEFNKQLRSRSAKQPRA